MNDWQVNDVCYYVESGNVFSDVITLVSYETKTSTLKNCNMLKPIDDLFKSKLDAVLDAEYKAEKKRLEKKKDKANSKQVGKIKIKSSTQDIQCCNKAHGKKDPYISVKSDNKNENVVGNFFIKEACEYYKEFLTKKNISYNGSAFREVIGLDGKVFSNTDTIMIRVQDKLRRLQSSQNYKGDDDIKDLTGYLILLKAVELFNTFNNK